MADNLIHTNVGGLDTSFESRPWVCLLQLCAGDASQYVSFYDMRYENAWLLFML